MGLFLDNCRNHLKEDGHLIIFTMNPFGLKNVIQSLRLNINSPDSNSEHTCYLSPPNIYELFNRSRFKVKDIIYAHPPYFKTHWRMRLRRFIEEKRGDWNKEWFITIGKPIKKSVNRKVVTNLNFKDIKKIYMS
jgi:16S rRNA G966 N2-methylase RsmD